MLARAQTDDHWNMQLLELEDPEFDPFFLHSVFRDDEPIGMVTSGAYGHRIQQAIGLAYFRVPVSRDEELIVEILGRHSKARIRTPL